MSAVASPLPSFTPPAEAFRPLLQVRFSEAGTPASSASSDQDEAEEVPTTIRYGMAAAQGSRPNMEDAAVAVERLLGAQLTGTDEQETAFGTRALFAVFDGHGGSSAANFAAEHIQAGLLGSRHFPADSWAEKDSADAVGEALHEAFLQIDCDYYAATSSTGSSAGTTALAAVVWGGQVVVANAGDSRAVVGRRGKAIQLTSDHKPLSERARIEASGGFVCADGRLCGELGVARAIGDYHYPELKAPPSAPSSTPVSRTGSAVAAAANGNIICEELSSAAAMDEEGAADVLVAVAPQGPLTAVPDVAVHELEATDEFMVLGCDGLWDVMASQRAIEFARQRLREHNDPGRCAEELVAEALRMHTSDNVTVIVVCFGTEPPKRRVYGSRSGSVCVSREASSRLSIERLEQLPPTAYIHSSTAE